MKDFEPQWKDGRKLNFVDYWRYDIQGAIYQEIVRQNIGKTLPFILAAATKEKTTDIGLFEIPQDVIDNALIEVVDKTPRFAAIKRGEISPEKCGKCDYCKFTKVLTGFSDYREMI